MILWDDESDLQVNGQAICLIYISLSNNGRLVAEKKMTPLGDEIQCVSTSILANAPFSLSLWLSSDLCCRYYRMNSFLSGQSALFDALPSTSDFPLYCFWDFSHAILRDLILLSLALLLQSPDSQLVFWCLELYLWMELAFWLERQILGYIQFLIILLHVFYILCYIPNLLVSPMSKCHI